MMYYLLEVYLIHLDKGEFHSASLLLLLDSIDHFISVWQFKRAAIQVEADLGVLMEGILEDFIHELVRLFPVFLI